MAHAGAVYCAFCEAVYPVCVLWIPKENPHSLEQQVFQDLRQLLRTELLSN